MLTHKFWLLLVCDISKVEISPGPPLPAPHQKRNKIERKRPKLCSQEGGPEWAHAMRELLVACTKWLQEMIIVSVLAVLVHISYPIHATHTAHPFVWRKLKSHTLEPSTYQQSTSWIHFLHITAWCMSRSNAKAYHWLYSHCLPSFFLVVPSSYLFSILFSIAPADSQYGKTRVAQLSSVLVTWFSRLNKLSEGNSAIQGVPLTYNRGNVLFMSENIPRASMMAIILWQNQPSRVHSLVW